MTSMIEAFLKRMCKQTAVYWGSPVDDGYGGKTFAEPVEIACRWEDKVEIISDIHGNEVVSHAVVYILQDVDEEGYLYLGTLDDLDSAAEDDPMQADGAYIIKRFDKSPDAKGVEFVRKAYL